LKQTDQNFTMSDSTDKPTYIMLTDANDIRLCAGVGMHPFGRLVVSEVGKENYYMLTTKIESKDNHHLTMGYPIELGVGYREMTDKEMFMVKLKGQLA
jgi:hypothetical protein